MMILDRQLKETKLPNFGKIYESKPNRGNDGIPKYLYNVINLHVHLCSAHATHKKKRIPEGCNNESTGVQRIYKFLIPETTSWLVVEPTHLKTMLVKMGSSSPIFGVKIKKNI